MSFGEAIVEIDPDKVVATARGEFVSVSPRCNSTLSLNSVGSKLKQGFNWPVCMGFRPPSSKEII